MPKFTDIKKIVVIGSGPIAIGQGPEFDYAGTQACLALKEEGYEVVLINSNPATIMTDHEVCSKVYMEPISFEYVKNILYLERPDAIIGTLGGQTGLNMLIELDEKGLFEQLNIKVLSSNIASINQAEDRELFRDLCLEIDEPCVESKIANTLNEAVEAARVIGYPIILRPAFTLGGFGSCFCDDEAQMLELCENALNVSPVSQVLVEKSIKNFKEIEYEVLRDSNGTKICICNMENIDPVGVHTGDSAVVAPSQTLTNNQYQMLRDSALKIVDNLKIIGGCNAQFALDPNTDEYFIIEVNPRVSRSSALASKATGYPIAYVSAKLAVGYTLDEIKLKNTVACFEPALDYVVTKLARFAFDKFSDIDNSLSTQMKATGEIMAIGRTFEESYLKATRSLENQRYYFKYISDVSNEEMLKIIANPTEDRYDYVYSLLKNNTSVDTIFEASKIDRWFLNKFLNIVNIEKRLIENNFDAKTLLLAKRAGISDYMVAKFWKSDLKTVREFKLKNDIVVTYKMVDSCASEFESKIDYYYSTYEQMCEVTKTDKQKVLVIGSGPNRIGQGVEFDYSTVHAIKAIKERGYEAIVINSNPGTVSTDYMISDRLYFEPLTLEDVLNVCDVEKPLGVIVSLGGQTPINLVDNLEDFGINILGTTAKDIYQAEDRNLFEALLTRLEIKQPVGKTVTDWQDGVAVCNELGYPVIIRPSFVLGGRAMKIVYNDQESLDQLKEAHSISEGQAILIDKYMIGKEVEVDAICDTEHVFIPGITEHIEKTGVHSGDSITVYPHFSLSESVKAQIIEITTKIGRELKIKGLFNIQFIVDKDEQVLIIEVNPRSSRSVPFLSKVTGVNMANIATQVMLGSSLADLGYTDNYLEKDNEFYYVKVPTFSFAKLGGADPLQSPEMKSTGEVIGYDKTLNKALYKGLTASGHNLSQRGTIFITCSDAKKDEMYKIAKAFYHLGFDFIATSNTAKFLQDKGINVTVVKKVSEDKSEITKYINDRRLKYIFNIGVESNVTTLKDAEYIRILASKSHINSFTSIDTIKTILSVIKENHDYVYQI